MPGYMALVEREMPITHEEAMRLGMRDMVDIAAAREEVKDVMTRAELRAESAPNPFSGFGGGSFGQTTTSSPADSRNLPPSDLRKRVEARVSRSTMRYPPVIEDTGTATTTSLSIPVVAAQENITNCPDDATPVGCVPDVPDEGPIVQDELEEPACESRTPVSFDSVTSIRMLDKCKGKVAKKGKKGK